jgi:hypothetical protein
MLARENERLDKVSYRLVVAKVEPILRREVARQRQEAGVDVAVSGRIVPKALCTAQYENAGGRTHLVWLYWP